MNKKFRGFPPSNPLIHINENNSVVDKTNHQFAQGWIQAIADVSDILSGQYGDVVKSTSGSIKAAFYPWMLGLHGSTTETAVITLPKGYFGVLNLYAGTALVDSIMVTGQEEISYGPNQTISGILFK